MLVVEREVGEALAKSVGESSDMMKKIHSSIIQYKQLITNY